MAKTDALSDGQRGFWTFLVATLIGPFFGAVAILLLTLAAGTFGFGPPSLKGLQAGQLVPLAAQRALEAYIWAAFPAAVAGAVCAAWISLKGALPWLVAATSGAVAATIAAIVVGGVARDHITPIAFIAASAAVVVWLILKRARIITTER
jgi:hypothetical protein